ncbi:hypothetical protein HN385_05430 [archaeon]|jgi:hypothetical protein|nr:hypothetical protein [archaeon]MBT3450952.1 hypothetical protein [archaeon]MBT6869475.1 hypothetical protein [archaeon]MBT7193163.1 hypothetical protein [archaeon]MBT7380469.1 hypothetical protein [archaeon]
MVNPGAIFSDISYAISSNAGSFAYTIGGIAIIILIFYFLFKVLPKYNEDSYERDIYRDSDRNHSEFWERYEEIRENQKRKKAEAKAAEEEARDREEHELAEEEAEDEGHKGKSKSDKKAEDVLKDVEDTEQDAEDAEQDIAKEEREVVAATAALENSSEDVIAEIDKMAVNEEVEQKEIIEIEALSKRIRSLNKFNKIDSTTADYLKQYFQSLDKHIKQQIGTEEKNEEGHKNLVSETKKTLKEFRGVTKGCSSEMEKLNKKSKNEKKSFHKEIKDIEKLIELKSKELENQKKEGKKGNPNLILQLERELGLLHKNTNNFKVLNSTLETTLNDTKKEIEKLKEIIRSVFKFSGKLYRFNRKLNEKEEDVGKRISKLKDAQNKISDSINHFEGERNIHGTVIKFSQEIEEYFLTYKEVIEADLGFQNKIKELLEDYYLTIKKMKTYTLLLISLEDSEKAIDDAMGAINTLIGIMFKEDVSGSLQKLNKIIKGNEVLLDYEKMMDKKLAALEEENEQQIMQATEKIKIIIGKSEKLISENNKLEKQEQQQLGNTIGTMVNRKVAIDEKYGSKVQTFEQSLKKRNEQAAAAYKQALAA